MDTAVATYTPPPPPAPVGLVPTDIQSAMDLAQMMATAKLVPQHFQGKPGDCLMVIEQAMRWRMSPFAVAQATSVPQGKLMFEGKLVAAAINASGILTGRLDYQYTGKSDALTVTVSGTIRGESKPRSVEVALKDAKTTNIHWSKSPEQMLSYHGARVWARRHAPEVMLGVYSPEEFDEPKQPPMRDVSPRPQAQPAAAPPPAPPTETKVIEVVFKGGTKSFRWTQRGVRELLDALWTEPAAALGCIDLLHEVSGKSPNLAAEVERIIAAATQAPVDHNPADDDDFPGDR